jgi:hypothetical protein
MPLKRVVYCIAILLFFIILYTSCKKEDRFITASDAIVSTSTDTLKFDTVFTTAGSVTKLFKIFNNNNQKLNISNIQLMGGATSFYKMNVDGLPGTQFNNIEIAANDSVYVYATVNVNPNLSSLPFIVRDSIKIQWNGNTQFVQLQAYGKNAIFLNNQKITGNVTWNNTLPYVILGGIRVDTTATLTIQKGTKIYLHANAPFIVDGTLIAQGEKWDTTKVVFQGDRLDEPYKNYPGAWPGIIFRGQSKNNQLQYAIVKNAFQALIVEGLSINANPKLTLNETIVDNAYDAGLLCVNGSVQARNSLFSNCGTNIGLTLGGQYNFNHCTVASYSNSNLLHKDPVLFATNYLRVNNTTVNTAAMNAQFTNCIFWGDFGTVEDEVIVDRLTAAPFTVNFNKCIYKVKTALNPLINNTAGLINTPPQFDSINTSRSFYNFRLKAASPALNNGAATANNTDLDGNNRPVGLPDIGCYEKQ